MSSAAMKRPKHRRHGPSPSVLREPSSSLFPSKDELLTLLAVVAIAASVAVACNYLAGVLTRRPRPFCESDAAFGDALSDLCDPCPDNGFCSSGNLECAHGYKKHGRVCVKDGEIDQMANKFSEWIRQHVCRSYAGVLCDETGKIWIQDSEIFEVLNEIKSNENVGLNENAYILVKHRTLEILESFLETRAIPNGTKEFKCPEVLAELHKPLSCCIQQWMYTHFLLIGTLSFLLVGFIRLILILRRKYYLSKRAEQLYAQVCEILEDNALMARSTSNEGEPWVVTSWLRDHLLLPRERKDIMLWKKVEELLLEDSRIDQYPKLIKGESKIVLEWQVDRPLSLKMRSKGAASKAKLQSDAGTPTTQERQSKVAEPHPAYISHLL